MLGIFPKDKSEKGELAHGWALGPQLMHHNNECAMFSALCVRVHGIPIRNMQSPKTQPALRATMISVSPCRVKSFGINLPSIELG